MFGIIHVSASVICAKNIVATSETLRLSDANLIHITIPCITFSANTKNELFGKRRHY